MLKVVNSKLHHYSKKEKSTFRRNNSWAVLEEHNRSKRYKDLGVTEKKGNWLKMEMEDIIMAAQDQALRTIILLRQLTSKLCLQIVEWRRK